MFAFKKMDYPQTLDYLYNQFPMFQRVGANAYKADLQNTIDICNFLGNPQNKFKSIHIAGTNGKGSVSHFIASVLQSAGMKVGLFTSPHLKDFRERIKINGKEITEEYVTDFVEKYKNDFEKIKPSFFEMSFGMASEYFSSENVDIAILETGLGGRLDSTNIITPEISIITNISFDHTNLLGKTIFEIANEKVGIIKNSIPVVIGETQKETKNIFIEKADLCKTKIYFADEFFKITSSHFENNFLFIDVQRTSSNETKKYKSELTGKYQLKNIVTALKSVEVLKEKGFNISEKNISEGFANVVKNTKLLGRWQVISQNPLTICDVAHNIAGIKEAFENIKQNKFDELHIVFGFVSDKEVDDILKLLPREANYYFCKANIPRALNEIELREKASNFGLKGNSFKTVKDALEVAKQNAKQNDLIFICGSIFVVAEII